MIVLDLFIKHSSNQVNTSFEQDAAFVSLKYIITFDRSLERLKRPSHLSHSIHLLTGISLSSRIIPYCLARMPVMLPHLPFPGETSERYFVVEKPGLDVASLGGVVEDVPDE